MTNPGKSLKILLTVLNSEKKMKYKVGDLVSVNVEVDKNKKRRLSIREPQPDSKIEIMNFPIVATDPSMETYKIIIEQDMPGWDISRFHTKYQEVDEKYLGKRFYDITEALILGAVKDSAKSQMKAALEAKVAELAAKKKL